MGHNALGPLLKLAHALWLLRYKTTGWGQLPRMCSSPQMSNHMNSYQFTICIVTDAHVHSCLQNASLPPPLNPFPPKTVAGYVHAPLLYNPIYWHYCRQSSTSWSLPWHRHHRDFIALQHNNRTRVTEQIQRATSYRTRVTSLPASSRQSLSIGNKLQSPHTQVHSRHDAQHAIFIHKLMGMSDNAQNPLHTFPRNFPVDGEAVNLLRTC